MIYTWDGNTLTTRAPAQWRGVDVAGGLWHTNCIPLAGSTAIFGGSVVQHHRQMGRVQFVRDCVVVFRLLDLNVPVFCITDLAPTCYFRRRFRHARKTFPANSVSRFDGTNWSRWRDRA